MISKKDKADKADEAAIDESAEATLGEDENKDREGNHLKKFVDGTARLGKSIGEAFKGATNVFKGRDYVVMVRVNEESHNTIDLLVEAGLFKSRSEAAAYLIAKGIEADSKLFGKLKGKVDEINRLRKELRGIVEFDEND